MTEKNIKKKYDFCTRRVVRNIEMRKMPRDKGYLIFKTKLK